MPNHFGKVLLEAAPAWATEGRVIGYTFGQRLSSREVDAFTKGASAQFSNGEWLKHKENPLPSVYYEAGHATLKHDKQGNLGWTAMSDKWTWLFFGNVPKYFFSWCREDVERTVLKGPLDKVQLRDKVFETARARTEGAV